MMWTSVRSYRVGIVAVLVLVTLAAGAVAGFLAVHYHDKKITKSPAVRVELVRTGGMANVNDRFGVDRTAGGSGELFSIVDGARFQSLRREYLPGDDCCDRFRYVLTAYYGDGTAKTVETIDDADAPDVLWRAIRLLTSTKPISTRK